MTIQNNAMNPVPIWPSKDYWQCNQVTFHDAMAWPLAAKGTFPTMQLTLANSDLPTESRNVVVHYGDPEDAVQYSGTLSVTGSMTLTYQLTRIIFEEGETENTYNVVFRDVDPFRPRTYQMYDSNGNKDIPASYFTTNASLYNSDNTFTLVFPDGIDMTVHTTLTCHLYKFDDTSASGNVTINQQVCHVPRRWRTNARYATMVVDTIPFTGSFDDGVYYITVVDKDNVKLYSEPFMWLANTSLFTLATYRRSEPVVTTENYMPFNVNGTAKSLTMYLRGRKIMPPFQFDADVDEIDGRKYPKKLVSYRKDRMEFHCYEAFMEAVRLLWHCDIRNVGGRRVDYMEPPEVDWSKDNHLCHVVLEFESDTVVQTNGLASAYGDSSDSEHTAYDASFDESFE